MILITAVAFFAAGCYAGHVANAARLAKAAAVFAEITAALKAEAEKAKAELEALRSKL